MMLDAERMIEAERVAQLQFAPQLLVTLMWCHSRLGPDVGEMGEFHQCTASFKSIIDQPRILIPSREWPTYPAANTSPASREDRHESERQRKREGERRPRMDDG